MRRDEARQSFNIPDHALGSIHQQHLLGYPSYDFPSLCSLQDAPKMLKIKRDQTYPSMFHMVRRQHQSLC